MASPQSSISVTRKFLQLLNRRACRLISSGTAEREESDARAGQSMTDKEDREGNCLTVVERDASFPQLMKEHSLTFVKTSPMLSGKCGKE